MLKFEKYHGLGNDFVIFNYDDLIKEGIKENEFQELAKKVCKRHVSIGGNGIMIYVNKGDKGQMIFINSDGSIGEMCGNGIRCFANYIYNNNLLEGNKYNIETLAGELVIEIKKEEEFIAKVNMGNGTFDTERIPVNSDKKEFIEETIIIDNKEIVISVMFMGVPHGVIFVDDIKKIDIEKIGKLIENNKLFPKKLNVNFVEIVNENEIKVDTWERGAGHTLACGTGSCASVIIGNYTKRLDKKVKVKLAIGDLDIEIKESVYMTGKAELVAKGFYRYKK